MPTVSLPTHPSEHLLAAIDRRANVFVVVWRASGGISLGTLLAPASAQYFIADRTGPRLSYAINQTELRHRPRAGAASGVSLMNADLSEEAKREKERES